LSIKNEATSSNKSKKEVKTIEVIARRGTAIRKRRIFSTKSNSRAGSLKGALKKPINIKWRNKKTRRINETEKLRTRQDFTQEREYLSSILCLIGEKNLYKINEKKEANKRSLRKSNSEEKIIPTSMQENNDKLV